MAVRYAGKPVVEAIREDLKARISKLNQQGTDPAVFIIRVGENESDKAYERGILKNCDMLGITAEQCLLPESVTTEEVLAIIERENVNEKTHGIMMFRPLPKHLDEAALCAAIAPAKDIDVMTAANLENVFEGRRDAFAPCTPEAVVAMLKHYVGDLTGRNIVVCGRSMVVGKPLAMLLLNENATVTICHSKTKDLPAITKAADIVVCAIGRARMFGPEYFRPESIVIDVGINDDGNGGICGDVDYDAVFDQVAALSPATGGVGTITTTQLLSHVVVSAERSVTC